uniref:Uncharacterized protein n=1 Tax=Cucumis melo TaxID=3656 RepID=A0A9I9DEH6_CUCME
MALFLPRSDPNPLLNKTLTRSKLTNNPEQILERKGPITAKTLKIKPKIQKLKGQARFIE